VHRQYNEDLFESSKMTFGEHLDELRRSLLKAVVALAIGFSIGLWFAGPLVDYVQTPLKAALEEYYIRLATEEYIKELEQHRDAGGAVPEDVDAAAKTFAEQGLVTEERLIDPYDLARVLPDVVDASKLPKRDPDGAIRQEDLITLRLYQRIEDDPRVRIVGLRVEEPFTVWIKAALVLGTIISSPFVFYFIWQFVAAGLYPHEQRYIHVFLPFSIVLFLAGAALAFFVVFRFVLAFLLTFFDWMGIDPEPRISDWLNFVLIMPLGFGISFQLPLVMLFLERIGIFSTITYVSSWRIAVLVIAFLSMILTPSDPYSMILMGAPLIALYFFGILLCRWMPRRTTPFGEVID
jgi:sec-independent protein translocase protein TatC